MSKPNLKTIEEKLKKGEMFSLTDAQYTKKTGLALPKEKNYLLKHSALARLCKKYGYSLSLIEKQVEFKKEA
ncbi:MAG: hypothetical protein J6Q94_00445 [Clostridia bacterium]|nr:hypothetical protein [Clostridia bacterium]